MSLHPSVSGALPEPDEAARRHSGRVVAHLREVIAHEGGWIPLERYLREVLYAPGLGYYVAGARKLGADGDFVTAPEMTPLYGAALATPIATILDGSRAREIVELGAGSGALAASLLAALAAAGVAVSRYRIVEVSPELRARQRAALAGASVPVTWCETLPDAIDGAVVLNEVLDAVPPHVVARRDGAWFERGVALAAGEGARPDHHAAGAHADGRAASAAGNGPGDVAVAGNDSGDVAQSGHDAASAAHALMRVDRPLRDATLRGLAAARFPPAIDYESEVNPAAEALVGTLARRLEGGAIVIADYGFPQSEYYLAQRSTGTLVGHYRHRVHADPLLWPGLSDLTAHVDFTAMATVAHEAGLKVAGFTSQAAFLVAAGILDRLAAQGAPESTTYIRAAAAVQRLLSPAEMGELFKVLVLARDDGIVWRYFAGNDRSHRL